MLIKYAIQLAEGVGSCSQCKAPWDSMKLSKKVKCHPVMWRAISVKPYLILRHGARLQAHVLGRVVTRQVILTIGICP